jgi:protein-S-isoprenylcysteine O-methyltransferase Ste14
MSISKYQKIFGVGPFGLLIGLLLLGALLLIDSMYQHVAILSRARPLRVIGTVLLAIWICWHFWCFRTIYSCWTKDRLCTKGPYRFVRHPMYAGGVFLAGTGVALMFNSWIILLWPFFAYTIWSVLVRKEERMMAAIFGEEYDRYAMQTCRLFPRLRRKRRLKV